MGGNQTSNDVEYVSSKALVCAFIHDAFIFEYDEGTEDQVFNSIRRNMEEVDVTDFDVSLSVPFVAEAETGYRLSEMVELKLGG
jgi:hypothetical protein